MIEDLLHREWALTPTERRRLMKPNALAGRGYAAPPGTGPAGETCRTCQHFVRRHLAKTYRKCALTLTGGAATDIHAKAAACRHWEKPT